MKNETQIINETQDAQQQVIQQVCTLLSNFNGDMRMYLADVVAALCNISVTDMMVDNKNIDCKHARWLYWSAHRYMFDESYDSMAKENRRWGKITPSGICKGVITMSMMVNKNPMWSRRWTILRYVIKSILKGSTMEQDMFQIQPVTVKVVAPKNINVELKQE